MKCEGCRNSGNVFLHKNQYLYMFTFGVNSPVLFVIDKKESLVKFTVTFTYL